MKINDFWPARNWNKMKVVNFCSLILWWALFFFSFKRICTVDGVKVILFTPNSHWNGFWLVSRCWLIRANMIKWWWVSPSSFINPDSIKILKKIQQVGIHKSNKYFLLICCYNKFYATKCTYYSVSFQFSPKRRVNCKQTSPTVIFIWFHTVNDVSSISCVT